jgi:hypothetical protein
VQHKCHSRSLGTPGGKGLIFNDYLIMFSWVGLGGHCVGGDLVDAGD